MKIADSSSRALIRRSALSLVVGTAVAAGCTPGIATGLVEDFANTFGDSVTIPDSDQTPPSVRLVFDRPGSGTVELVPGDAPVTVTLEAGERFFVVGSAEDPEGVKQVSLVGEAQVNCTSDGIGSITHFLLNAASIDDGGPGDIGLTRRWVPFLLSVDEWSRCFGEGFEQVSTTITLQAVGRNFSDLTTTTPPVTFGHAP